MIAISAFVTFWVPWIGSRMRTLGRTLEDLPLNRSRCFEIPNDRPCEPCSNCGVKNLPLWRSLLTLAAAVMGMSACSGSECKSVEDCPSGSVCGVLGACVPTQPPVFPEDTGTIDGSFDVPSPGGVGSDAGDAGVPDVDVGGVQLPNQTFVTVRQVNTMFGPVSEIEAYLQDRSSALYTVQTQTFMVATQTGNTTCELTEENLVSGAIQPILVREIQASSSSQVTEILTAGSLGKYSTSAPVMFPFVQPGVVNQFVDFDFVEEVGTGPRLEAVMDEMVTVPADILTLTPGPGVSLVLSPNTTFNWAPDLQAAPVELIMTTIPDRGLRVSCVLPDSVRPFTIPQELIAAFTERRGSRAATLSFVRANEVRRSVLRLDSSDNMTENVVFRVEVGTRYSLL